MQNLPRRVSTTRTASMFLFRICYMLFTSNFHSFAPLFPQYLYFCLDIYIWFISALIGSGVQKHSRKRAYKNGIFSNPSHTWQYAPSTAIVFFAAPAYEADLTQDPW